MKYAITRAICRFENGTTTTINYSVGKRICKDIEKFRAELKESIEKQITDKITELYLQYEEYDD